MRLPAGGRTAHAADDLLHRLGLAALLLPELAVIAAGGSPLGAVDPVLRRGRRRLGTAALLAVGRTAGRRQASGCRGALSLVVAPGAPGSLRALLRTAKGRPVGCGSPIEAAGLRCIAVLPPRRLGDLRPAGDVADDAVPGVAIRSAALGIVGVDGRPGNDDPLDRRRQPSLAADEVGDVGKLLADIHAIALADLVQEILGAVDPVGPEVPRVGGQQAPWRLGQAGLVLEVAPGAQVAAEVAVAEAVHRGEVPLGVDTPAAAGPAVDPVAVPVAVPRVVELAVVAHRHPAGPAAGPVPVDPGRGVDRAGSPDPTVAGQAAPATVVIRNPAPGLVRDPGIAGGGPVPSTLPVGAPAGGNVRPPVAHALVLDPVAGLIEGRGVVGEMGLDVARAARGGERPVGECGAPALERIRRIGRGELQPRPAVTQRRHGLLLPDDGGAAIGDDLGVAATRHDARPGLAVVVHAGLDAVLARLLDIDRRVGGDDPRQLVSERIFGNLEEQLAPFETQHRHPFFTVAGEGEALQDDAGVGVEVYSIAVGKRELQTRARADAKQISGEQRLVELERVADAFAGRSDGRVPLQRAQERVAGALVGERGAVDGAGGGAAGSCSGALGKTRRRDQECGGDHPGSASRCRPMRVQDCHFSYLRADLRWRDLARCAPASISLRRPPSGMPSSRTTGGDRSTRRW